MSRRTLAVALALALLLPVLADAKEGRDGRRAARQEMMERWDDLNQTQRARGLERAAANGLFAHLGHDAATGQAAGGYLRFRLQAETGALQDVAVRANRSATLVPLLAAVTPAPFATEAAPVARGAMLRLEGDSLDFTAHNDPSASLTWHAGSPANLTLTLAPGLQAFRPDAQTRNEVRVTVGATHAHIAANGQATLQLSGDNRTVTVALAAGDSAVVRLHPHQGGETLHDQLAAFRANRLGAAMRVTDAGGVPMEDGESADVTAHAKEIRRGRVVWEVASDQTAGRVLFLTLDNGTVDVAQPGRIQLTLDGAALRRAESAASVLAASDGAFAVAPSADGRTLTVAVAIPHFSSYALALTQGGVGGASGSSDSPGGAADTGTRGTPGPAVATLLAALGLALLARRRA